MAVSLAEVGVDSIPLNALMPIAGTPLEGLEPVSYTHLDVYKRQVIGGYNAMCGYQKKLQKYG